MKFTAILALVVGANAIQIQEMNQEQYWGNGIKNEDGHKYWYKPGFNKANYKASEGGPYVPYYMNDVSKKQWQTTDGGMVVGLEGRNGGFRSDATAEPTS